MSLEVLQAGLLTTVQDAGRIGHRSLGIHPTGAMDTEAFYMANALVGNPDEMAVLELHFPAGRFVFHTDACFSITGAHFDPQLNGASVDGNRLLTARKGSILSFARPVFGARAYLAVAGGFQLDRWLASHSTDRSARAGGWKGRALVRGDRLSFNHSIRFHSVAPKDTDIRSEVIPASGPLQLLFGPEWDNLSPIQQEHILQQPWQVTPQSDRMGIRLKPTQNISADLGSMVSAPAVFGTIQYLPNGELIVLMADHPVTGGYSRIAHLPYFERSRLAQAVSGQSFFLELLERQQVLNKNQDYAAQRLSRRESVRSAAQSYLTDYVIER